MDHLSRIFTYKIPYYVRQPHFHDGEYVHDLRRSVAFYIYRNGVYAARDGTTRFEWRRLTGLRAEKPKAGIAYMTRFCR